MCNLGACVLQLADDNCVPQFSTPNRQQMVVSSLADSELQIHSHPAAILQLALSAAQVEVL